MDTAFDRPTGLAAASFEGLSQFSKLFSSGTIAPTKMAGLHTLKSAAERGRKYMNASKLDPATKASIEKYGVGINTFYKKFLQQNLEKPNNLNFKKDLENEISGSENETEAEEEASATSSLKRSSTAGVFPETGGEVPNEEGYEPAETAKQRRARLQRERRAKKKAAGGGSKTSSETEFPLNLPKGKKKASAAIAESLQGGGGT